MSKKNNPAGYPLGSRTERPHAPDGWDHDRDEKIAPQQGPWDYDEPGDRRRGDPK